MISINMKFFFQFIFFKNLVIITSNKKIATFIVPYALLNEIIDFTPSLTLIIQYILNFFIYIHYELSKIFHFKMHM